jgi:hypothetical protein
VGTIKSFRRKDGSDKDRDGRGRNAERSFHKEKRSNETHESTTDPEALLYRKGSGRPARFCYMGHAPMENRHGLAVGGQVSEANGTAERDAALKLIDRHRRRRRGRRITLGADKANDVTDFVQELRKRQVTAHIAINGHVRKSGKPRKTAIDGRTPRHPGYSIRRRCRKRIEEVFGWIESSAGFCRGEAARSCTCGCRLHHRVGGLQSHPPAETPEGRHVKGKWPIVKIPDCVPDYPDMAEPAYTRGLGF